eukprot:31029-Pelagococcus_subviridis.AAC.15
MRTRVEDPSQTFFFLQTLFFLRRRRRRRRRRRIFRLLRQPRHLAVHAAQVHDEHPRVFSRDAVEPAVHDPHGVVVARRHERLRVDDFARGLRVRGSRARVVEKVHLEQHPGLVALKVHRRGPAAARGGDPRRNARNVTVKTIVTVPAALAQRGRHDVLAVLEGRSIQK